MLAVSPSHVHRAADRVEAFWSVNEHLLDVDDLDAMDAAMGRLQQSVGLDDQASAALARCLGRLLPEASDEDLGPVLLGVIVGLLIGEERAASPLAPEQRS